MAKKEIVVASNNAHKVLEIQQILGDCFDKIYSLKDLGIDVEVEENGVSFFENALIKAQAISKLTDVAILADDSGLEVEALNGQPGIRSARFAGDLATDQDNIDLLLHKMVDVANRQARFVCCMVIVLPNGKIISAEGTTEGEILRERKGGNGFGYDAVFYSYQLLSSFGEVEEDKKNAVSHRKQALEKIKCMLDSLV